MSDYTVGLIPGDLGVLVDAPDGCAGALERLKETWGDFYEHLRLDPDGVWRGRRRTGDGREFASRSAGGLDALFREEHLTINLYRDGLSMQRVAGQLRISPRKVRSILDSAGIPRRRGISGSQAAAIAAAVTDGTMTRRQAADECGLTPSRVGRALARQGVVLMPGKDHLRAADAAAVAGVSVHRLGELARAGKVGSVRGSARGHRLYARTDMEAIRARRERRAPGSDR